MEKVDKKLLVNIINRPAGVEAKTISQTCSLIQENHLHSRRQERKKERELGRRRFRWEQAKHDRQSGTNQAQVSERRAAAQNFPEVQD
jgi:hypothetical protein